MTSKNEPLTTPALTGEARRRDVIASRRRRNSPNFADCPGPRFEIVETRDREGRVHVATAQRSLTDVDETSFVAIDERTGEARRGHAEDRGVAPMPEPSVR